MRHPRHDFWVRAPHICGTSANGAAVAKGLNNATNSPILEGQSSFIFGKVWNALQSRNKIRLLQLNFRFNISMGLA